MINYLISFITHSEIVLPIKQLLEKYLGSVVEVYRRCNSETQCLLVVLDCAGKFPAVLQLDSGRQLVLLNIDIDPKSSLLFNYEVSKYFATLFSFIVSQIDISTFLFRLLTLVIIFRPQRNLKHKLEKSYPLPKARAFAQSGEVDLWIDIAI